MNYPATGNIICNCGAKEIFRILFTDHVIYTKLVVVSILNNLPDLNVSLNRLLKNQEDIGNGLKLYTTDEIGNELTKLLKKHITLAGNYITAISSLHKDNNKQIIENSKNELFKNSDDVSLFISNINPDKYPLNEIKKQFRQHNQHLLDMTMSYHNGEYEKENNIFDAYFKHMIMFSDILSAGLSNQRGGDNNYLKKYKKYKFKYISSKCNC
jgi:hypothetical protein